MAHKMQAAAAMRSAQRNILPTAGGPPPGVHLLASTMLNGGTLRSLAVAAGMMTAFGVSPALAQCFSGTGGVLDTAACEHTAATGVNSTAVGSAANATGIGAT